MNRRRQDLVTLPSGAILDRAAFRDLMAEWDARAPKPAVVQRLSTSDPEIVAFEATARRGRAA